MLGNGTLNSSAVPEQVLGVGGIGTLSGVAELADVNRGYCALLTSGGVDCWGAAINGNLGSGTYAVPVQVLGVGGIGILSGVVAISAAPSDRTICALLTTGGVDCWGYGYDGELGNGTFYTWPGNYGSAVPVQVVSVGGTGTLSGVASLASDLSGYCALLTSGGVDCWGTGYRGELGNGSYGLSAVPVQVVGVGGSGTLSGVASLASDLSGYCALLTSGGVDCWGYGYDGELGNGTFYTSPGNYGSAVPVQVVSVGGTGTLSGVAALTGGSGYCALLTSGGVDCWGDNIGNGTFSSSAVPVQVVGVGGSGTLSGVAALTGGYCALLTSGGVDCWGSGQYGELGNGIFYTTGNLGSAAPVQVVDVGGTGTLSGVAALADGVGFYRGYCALLTSGGVDCWSHGHFGELGDGIFYPSALDSSGLSGSATPVEVGVVLPFPGAPPAQATQGGGFPYGPQDTCKGCPINTATGEFYQTFHDLAIPGRGMPLDFSRTYSSVAGKAGENGPLGPGWTHTYNWGLHIDGSGNASVSAANGSSVSFTSNGSGGFVAPLVVPTTLVKNTNGTYTFTGSDQKRYVFSATGQLISEVDRNGYVTSLAYSGGKLATVTDPAGRALTFAYGTNGDLASVTDPAGRKVSFTYDGSGNLATSTDPAGRSRSYGYDSGHLMTSLTDRRGGVLTNVYDTSGRVTSETDPMGRTITFTYTTNSDGSETTVETSPKGNVTDWNYNNLTLTSVTRGAGTAQAATTTYTYDPTTYQISTVSDPNGHTTSYTHDARGNVLTKTDPLGHGTTYTYNKLNEVLTTTDPNGVTSTNSYDTKGNLLSTSTPVNGKKVTTTYTYGDATHPGDVTSVGDPDKHVTTYTYDAQGDRTSSTDAMGDTTTYAFNLVGEKTSMVTPRGNVTGGLPANFTTTYTYDPLGDLLTTTDPLGHITTNTYDAEQNLATTTDAKGNVTTNTYDLDNENTATVRTDSSAHMLQSQTTSYDADGNVASQTDGLGHSTAYAFDALNRKITSTDALGRATTYSYDGASNVLTLTDPSGRVTTYTYDAGNELTGVSYSDGVTHGVTYTYDADGQQLTMTDGTGTTTTTRDALHRVISVTNGAGAIVAYTYDATGNLIGLTYPGGNTVLRAYDRANRLRSVTDWLGHTTGFVSDPDANLTTETYPNGIKATSTYDHADQPMFTIDRAGTTTLLRLPYSNDTTGMITSEGPITYTYDAANRVVSTSVAPKSYAYDTSGQLTDIGPATLSYDAAGELTSLIAPSQTVTLRYDLQGNRTSASPTSGTPSTYTYDQANRLTGLTQGATSASYAYDGDGLRMSKAVNGTSEAFTWNESGSLPLLLTDGTTDYVYGLTGLPIEQITGGGTVTYYHQDHLGSTRMLTSSTGAVVGTYAYGPYGNITKATGSVANPLQFAGQYLDSESGLYYLRARYYSPSTGQFRSVDPIVKLTRSPYGYAKDNPVNASDPTGRSYQDCQKYEDSIGPVDQAVQGLFLFGTNPCGDAAGAVAAAPVVAPVFDRLATVCSEAAFFAGGPESPVVVAAEGCALVAGGWANVAHALNAASGCESTRSVLTGYAFEIPGQALGAVGANRLGDFSNTVTGEDGIVSAKPSLCC